MQNLTTKLPPKIVYQQQTFRKRSFIPSAAEYSVSVERRQHGIAVNLEVLQMNPDFKKGKMGCDPRPCASEWEVQWVAESVAL